MELRYIGSHQPKGMIIDISEDRAEDFINGGDYELITAKKIKVSKKSEVTTDDKSE